MCLFALGIVFVQEFIQLNHEGALSVYRFHIKNLCFYTTEVSTRKQVY